MPGLFARLTRRPKPGAALFDRVVGESRRPHWFVQGEVPDTLNGRFAMLATITAIVLARLERDGDDGICASAGLTERFIEALDAEHRQMGVNDPALGKQVRRLVGALERRLMLFRELRDSEPAWTAAVLQAIYRDAAPSDEALAHSRARLRELSQALDLASAESAAEGLWR